MIFSKIWERYFVAEFLKTFLLFLLGFYGLYALIDYSVHVNSFNYIRFTDQWKMIVLYYGSEFINRSDVIVPFGLLIATIKTLTRLNQSNELVALLTSGIKLQTLMRPFLIMGLVFTALLYLSTEVILPNALREMRHIDDAKRIEKNKKYAHAIAQHIFLEDNTTIIFQHYDSFKQQFFDVYWIRSLDDLYRMKYLYPYTSEQNTSQPNTSQPNTSQPRALFVDHLVRNEKGDLFILESFSEKNFPEMHFNKERLFETLTTPEEHSLSELYEKLPDLKNLQSEKEYQLLTIFNYKLLIPWLCLLSIIAPAPFCIRYSRNVPVFFIYACSIFGFVAFYTILDSATVLAKRQAIYPIYALSIPFLLAFTFFGWRFFRPSY